MGKRQLGLGRALQAKKKQQSPEQAAAKTEGSSNDDYYSVPLEVEADPNNEISQLKALWKTWLDSDRENELILNGVVNECDRLAKEQQSAELYAIFGLALAELAKFHTDDDKETAGDFLQSALDKIKFAEEKYPKEAILPFAESSILLTRIPLQYISQMTMDSKAKEYPNISKMLKSAIAAYNKGVQLAGKEKKVYEEPWIIEIFESLDDLGDIIRNFYIDKTEEVDSEEEEEEEEEEDEGHGVLEKLPKDHPLYEALKELEDRNDPYGSFFEKGLAEYIKNLESKELTKRASQRLGLWYLAKSEKPSRAFAKAAYDDETEDYAKIEQLRSEAMALVKPAVDYLKQVWDDEIPSTWADLAEAQISYGNLLESDSVEQENYYTEAAKNLRKANNATHGKYREVLESLEN